MPNSAKPEMSLTASLLGFASQRPATILLRILQRQHNPLEHSGQPRRTISPGSWYHGCLLGFFLKFGGICENTVEFCCGALRRKPTGHTCSYVYVSDKGSKPLIRSDVVKSKPFEPKILAFICNWCAYGAADLAGVSRMQYPPIFAPYG